MAQTAAVVSLDEYLATRYRPDVEYLDGELKARTMISPAHGQVQVAISSWFFNHKNEWRIQVVVKARTQVGVDRVRLPDIAVLAIGPLPKKALVDPPLIAIEVLSETDSCSDLKARAMDFKAMGVRNVWLVDPKGRTAEVWSAGSWQLHTEALLHAVDSPIYLDLAWLWENSGPEID